MKCSLTRYGRMISKVENKDKFNNFSLIKKRAGRKIFQEDEERRKT